MEGKSAPIKLIVLPLTPEDDYFVDIEPLEQHVYRGEVASFLVVLSGNYDGLLDVEVLTPPPGAAVLIDPAPPVAVPTVAVLSVKTNDIPPDEYKLFVNVAPAKTKKK